DLLGFELVGSFGLYAAVHPMQLHVGFAGSTFEFERDMRRRRTAVGEIALLEFACENTSDTTLSLRGVIEVEHLEGRSDDMATHVTQCSGTIIPPAAPVKRNEVVDVIFLRRRTEPKVPVQFRWNGGAGGGPLNALRPHRPVRKAKDLRDVADDTGTIPVDQQPNPVTGSSLVAHLGHDLIPGSRFGEHPDLIDIMRQRLLNVDVLTQLHGRHADNGVHMVGRRNGHRVDVFMLLFKHFAVILVTFGLREFLYCIRGATVVYVAENSDIGLSGTKEIIDIRLPFAADADAGDRQLVAGSDESLAAQYVTGDDVETGSGDQTVFQETATRIAQ